MKPSTPPSSGSASENNHRVHILQTRRRLLKSIRTFFDARGYLSVDTPLRIKAPALEDYIDAEPSGNRYLRTSPELHMKRLLGIGLDRIYQLGPCFRKGELGAIHLPEFCMLEWYRTETDCYGILGETVDLVRHSVETLLGGTALTYGDCAADLAGEWQMLSVDDAFRQFANSDRTVDMLLEDGEFEDVLLRDVQPHLGYARPTVLHSFPAGMSSLAGRCRNNPDRVERWELFIHGIELANAYTELTDYEDQLYRFNASRKLREAAGRDVYPADHEYLQLLREQRLPPCGGIAFGVDRFLMLICKETRIQNVVPFAEDHC